MPTLTDAKVEPSTLFDGEAWARLSHFRAAHDPAGVFVANHQIYEALNQPDGLSSVPIRGTYWSK